MKHGRAAFTTPLKRRWPIAEDLLIFHCKSRISPECPRRAFLIATQAGVTIRRSRQSVEQAQLCSFQLGNMLKSVVARFAATLLPAGRALANPDPGSTKHLVIRITPLDTPEIVGTCLETKRSNWPPTLNRAQRRLVIAIVANQNAHLFPVDTTSGPNIFPIGIAVLPLAKCELKG